jgi:hypothetical protein
VESKRWVILAVLLCLIASGLTCSAKAQKDTAKPQQEATAHTVAAPERDRNGCVVMENSRYLMYLDEKTLGISIEDRETNFTYSSVIKDEKSNPSWQGFLNSGVSVEFYTQKSTMPERVDLIGGTPAITYSYYTDGFDALLSYEAYEFQMTVEVRLTEDGMTAGVKKDSIAEGETYKLGAVYLYPMFGATKLGEETGYMFVPEGAGALIDLKDNNSRYKTPYTKKIFGDNIGIDKFAVSEFGRPSVTEPEPVTMPVFGMVYTEEQQGFLGIAEDGRYNAQILAYPNGVITEYNWITAKFIFREVYTKQTTASTGVPSYEKDPYMRDIKIHYKLVSGDQANYTGLAKAYQTYLLQKGDLKKQEDTFEMKLDFFGADSKKWFIYDVVVPMTTVEQMGDILQDLSENGIKNILPVYFGWQSKGISLNYGSGNFKLEGKLGKKKELFSLIEKQRENNIDIALQQDFLKANPGRFYNTSKDIVKGINQIIVEEPTNASVFKTMYYLTPAKAISHAEKFADYYSGSAVHDVALTSAGNMLFSCYAGGKIYSRGDTAEKIQKIGEELNEFNLSFEKPNAYLWKYTMRYFDMPMATSNYAYLSKEVPFLPIVIKGYIPYWASDSNFEANEKLFFLKMVEYGAYPSFLVTKESPSRLRNTNSSYIVTSQYEVLKDTMKDYYERIGEALRLVEGVPIKAHDYLTDNIVSVVYENQVEIIVNYSKDDYIRGGIMVPAMSFTVNKK